MADSSANPPTDNNPPAKRPRRKTQTQGTQTAPAQDDGTTNKTETLSSAKASGKTKTHVFDVVSQLPAITVAASSTTASSVVESLGIQEAVTAKDDKKKKKKLPADEYMKYPSFFIFSSTNPLRKKVHQLISWPWFERIVFVLIVINIITLAAHDPIEGLDVPQNNGTAPIAPPIDVNVTAPIAPPDANATAPMDPPLDPVAPPVSNRMTRNQVLDLIDYILLGLYTLEMLLKWFAMGLVGHPRAYFRSTWNALDFIVVVTSYVAIGEGSIFSVFKILRIFRPLKIVTGIPKLKKMVKAMGKSLPFLLNVIILMLVFYFIFGITGVEMFGGAFRRHCFDNATQTVVDYESVCRLNSAPAWQGGRYCPEGQYCERTDLNPNVNVTGFDTFPQAALTLFQSVTLEGWVYVGYWLQDASTDFGVIYILLVPLLGSFFFVNLFLATVQGSYNSTSEQKDEDDEEEAEAAAAAEQANGDSSGGTASPRAQLSTSATIERKKKSFVWRVKHWFQRQPADPSKPEDKPTGCMAAYSAWGQRMTETVCKAGWFRNIRDLIIIANIIMLGIKFYGESDMYALVLRYGCLVCMILFSIELAFTFLCEGVYNFISEKMNPFDVLVLILAWVQYGVSHGEIAGAFTVFRIFRLLRLFNYLDSWRRVNNLTKVFPKVVPFLFYNLILMLLFMFVFAVLGMQLFGGKYPLDDAIKPRLHYDSFFSAFLSTFTVITLENWNGQMYDAVRYSGSVWAALYFVVLIIITNYILLNLFLSILFNGFEEADDVSDRQEAEESNKQKPNKHHNSPDERSVELEDVDRKQEKVLAKELGEDVPEGMGTGVELERHSGWSKVLGTDIVQVEKGFIQHKGKVVQLRSKSLCCIPAASKLRIFFAHLITTKPYFWVMTVAILISCVTLILDTYPQLKASTTFTNALFAIDIIYVVIFGVEVLLNIIVYGLVAHEGAYLRKPSNVLDLLAWLIMLIDVCTWRLGIGAIKALRAARPLRVLVRFKNTRVIVSLLFKTLPELPAVLPIGLFIWILFAVLGVQLYSGGFARCNDPDPLIITRSLCVGNFTDDTGTVVDRAWTSPNDNFDHFFLAFFTIFKMSTGEGWPDVMFSTIDMTKRDQIPERSNNLLASAFFFGFVPLCVWFVLGLVIGSVIDTFNDMRKDLELKSKSGGLLLTSEQKQWVELQQVLISALPEKNPEKPTDPFRLLLYRFVTSKAFIYSIALVICLNILVLCMKWYHTTGVEDAWTDLQDYADYIFTVMYFLEFLMKVVAFGPRAYFTDGWNILDFIIVVISVVSMVGSFVPSFATINNLVKAFRVARTLRLLKITKYFKRLRILFKTAVLSIPGLYNAFSVLFIVFFAFAVIGNALFKDISTGLEINERANFHTFLEALFLCYRMSTGEAWNTIMHDVADATSQWAYIYFIVFVLLINFILLNMFTAVVIENFQFVTSIGDRDITMDDIEDFIKQWAFLDPKATGRIHIFDLPKLIALLKPPFGVGKNASKVTVDALINTLKVKVHKSYVYFPELLICLTQRVSGLEEMPDELMIEVKKKWKKRFIKKRKRTKSVINEAINTNLLVAKEATKSGLFRTFTVGEVMAAVVIQRAWRSALRRVRAQPKKKREKKWRPSRPSAGVKDLVALGIRKKASAPANPDEDEAAVVVDVPAADITAALMVPNPLATSLEVAIKGSTPRSPRKDDGQV